MAASKKRYNFKGLDDIFGESVSDIVNVIEKDKDIASKNSTVVKLDLLKPNPYQPRKIFSDEELNELKESILIHGLIQPIIINSKNEIVAGERRYRASKLAGLTEVPVVTLNLNNQQMEEFAIIENIQRVDLLDIEEAVAYKQLSKNLNLKQEEIATRVGKSRSHIANIMRLLNLPEYIQDAMLKRQLTMGQAKPLLTILSDTKMVKDIFNQIMEKNLTAREVENLIKSYSNPNGLKDEKVKTPDVIQMENKIMRRLGTKVSIDNNKLTIKYTNNDDLNRILEILGLTEQE